MALIICNRCGRQVSDRVKVCPHCGAELHRENATEVKSETTSTPTPPPTPTSNLTTCMHCGAMVSKKAIRCPKCGQPLQVVPPPPVPPTSGSIPNQSSVPNSNQYSAPVPPQPQRAVPSGNANPVYYSDEEENTSAHVGLKVAVTILALIAIIFGCFLLKGSRFYNGKTFNYPIDSAFVDDTPVVDSTPVDSAVVDSVDCDSTVYDDYADSTSVDYSDYSSASSEPVGFTSGKDVWDYVRGVSYTHGDITLCIQSDGIYANGNKISTSAPKFYRISPSRGKIVASPSISITVDRDYNNLTDNNSGEVYN